MQPPLDPKQATDQSLLTAFAALTHQMHAADRSKAEDAQERSASLRDQRNLLEDEILHRMSSEQDSPDEQGITVKGTDPKLVIDVNVQLSWA